MDYIVLDTETTGLDSSVDRVIEIGAIKIKNRKITDDCFHVYLQPDREIHPDAIAVHGITNEFLMDKPRFSDISDAFIDWIKGATLIIHNAGFDAGFLDMELKQVAKSNLTHYVIEIIDTLKMARSRHRGKKNDLDSLLARYGIENTERNFHGALLDAKLLAALYIKMTQKQQVIEFGSIENHHIVFENIKDLDDKIDALDFSWIE